MEQLENKVIVITGASSGLGAEAARHLVRAGAKVALGARRRDRLDALVNELGDDNAVAFTVDVKDSAAMQAFVTGALETFGRIDAMLHNAGVMPLAPLAMNRQAEWDECIDVNLKGVLYGIGAVLPIFQSQGFGHNVFVSSVAGHVANPVGAVYCATKFGVRAIAEALRQEVKQYGPLRTTVLSPGAVETELPASVKAEGISEFVAGLYAEQAIPAASFARAVVFALSQPSEVDISEILFRPTKQSH